MTRSEALEFVASEIAPTRPDLAALLRSFPKMGVPFDEATEGRSRNKAKAKLFFKHLRALGKKRADAISETVSRFKLHKLTVANVARGGDPYVEKYLIENSNLRWNDN